MSKKSTDRRIQFYLTEAQIKKAEKRKADHKNRHRWAASVMVKELDK